MRVGVNRREAVIGAAGVKTQRQEDEDNPLASTGSETL